MRSKETEVYALERIANTAKQLWFSAASFVSQIGTLFKIARPRRVWKINAQLLSPLPFPPEKQVQEELL